MNKKIIIFMPLLALVFACAAGQQGQQPVVQTLPASLVFERPSVERAGLPNMQDLPIPASIKTAKNAPYTGIIKNETKYEVSIPSENSDATLLIPPHEWIEYTTWTRQADVTAYHEGKPFYCLTLNAHPKKYPFMCKKYDFMAEIVKPEGAGAGKYKPMKKRKRIKKQTEA